MKFSEMNAHQKIAYVSVVHACNELVSGSYVSFKHPEEVSKEEYESAKAFINSGRENIINEVYKYIIQESDKKVLHHLEYAGIEFIRERIVERLDLLEKES